MKKILLKSVLCLMFVLAVCSCEQKGTKRKYTEITVASPLQASFPQSDPHAFLKDMTDRGPIMPQTQMGAGMADLPVAANTDIKLVWQVPDGWLEEPGSGMRLATFRSQTADDLIECSIVSLGGMGGGLESNVVRWMQQLNLPVLSEEQLSDFLKSQKKIVSRGDFEGTVIDLADLQKKTDLSTASMIAAILTAGENTIFVKMTGTLKAVLDNREKFETLCQSLAGP